MVNPPGHFGRENPRNTQKAIAVFHNQNGGDWSKLRHFTSIFRNTNLASPAKVPTRILLTNFKIIRCIKVKSV